MNGRDPIPDPAMLEGMEHLIAAMKERPPAPEAYVSTPGSIPLPSHETDGVLAAAPWQAVELSSAQSLEETLRESQRFDIVRRLGEGGMGVVYHARDRVRGLDVALKTLTRMGPSGILRLKREFRAIADLTHRNLISLYELVCADDRWFFTMELVRGVDFITHVRGGPADAPGDEVATPRKDAEGFAPTERRPVSPLAPTDPMPRPPISPLAPTEHMPRPPALPFAPTDPLPPPPVSPRTSTDPMAPPLVSSLALVPTRPNAGRLDLARLRGALKELVAAVSTLHAAGKAHLDLKPSNVLVDESGRIVVLDFGLVQDVHATPLTPGGHPIAGTPAYMAPEQLLGELSPAADWYAVGVILYEALTGHLPFSGSVLEIATSKVNVDPVAPIEIDAGVDPELSRLCMRLLHRQQSERAGGADILQAIRRLPRLDRPRAGATATAPGAIGPSGDTMLAVKATQELAALPPEHPMFVGRDEHLRLLTNAFDAARNGRGVVVYVHGRSGMGKSALVQRFEDILRTDRNTLVLSGRCYERESVPFKALDGIIDALSLHLRQIPRQAAQALLPEGIHELVRIFPILGMIGALSDVPQRATEIVDPYELRIRAFRALKELLRHLAKTVPLVLRIDDLQWGDRDSAKLLNDLLGPPDPPPLLLVCTYRSEDEATSPCLVELFDSAAARLVGATETRKLHLGPLTGEQSEALARSLLHDDGKGTGLAAELAREAAGSPYFLTELVRHSSTDTGASPSGDAGDKASATSLDALLLGRIATLPDPARRILEVIAVAGQPLEQGVARQAVGAEEFEPSALLALRSGHLVRTGGLEATDAIEAYHDRVRELVVGRIEPVRLAGHHRRLAEQLESTGRADPERLAVHFHGAGDLHKAAGYAVTAADKAGGALAFDNAARLYRMALELSPSDHTRHHDLFAKLGDALANAGRGPEAAQAYENAASLATDQAMPVLALDDKRLAAEQFLKSGHTAAGVKVLRDVLAAVDLGYPETPEQAIAAWRARQAEIDARGWAFEARDASGLQPAVLRRIDVCFSAFIGLFTVDSVGAFSFHGQHVLLSLAAGEPTRIALGLAFETMFAAKTGDLVRMRSAYEAVEAVLGRAANPRAECVLRIARGIRCFLTNWNEAMEHGLEAERIAREECTGVAWEVATAQLVCVLSLTARAELDELGRRLPSWIKEGEEHGNRYAVTSLSTFMGGLTLLAVARGDVVEARKELDRVMAKWSEQGFSIQHYHAVYSHALIDMYSDKGADAWRRVEDAWPSIERSGLLGLQTVRVQALDLRGRAALGGSESATDAEPALHTAEEAAADLEQQQQPWPSALALGLRAGIAFRRKHAMRAQSHLRAAIVAFDALDMALHAASARKRLGTLVGGEEGKALVAAADAFMRNRTIREPDGIAAAFIPGFREESPQA